MLPLLIGGAIGSAIGNVYQSSQANKAAKRQARAAYQANEFAGQQFGQTQQAFDPYVQSGRRALGAYDDSLGFNGQAAADGATAAFFNSPDYKLAANEGMQDIQDSAAARGSLFGGSSMKSLGRFRSDLATRRLGDWRNAVGGQIDRGMNATGAVAGARQRYSDTYGQNLMGAADARGRGDMASGQALGDFMGDATALAGRYYGYRGGR